MNLYNPFLKTISIDQFPEEAWKYFGANQDSRGLDKIYQAVPWLFRGVDIRANAVATMPFSIYKGEAQLDSSEDYQNKLGFLPDPGALFGLLEMALTIWGRGYLFKERSVFMQKGVRYLDPRSITYSIDQDGGVSFTRTVSGVPRNYTEDDIIYFWKGDPFVEKGAPTASPAIAAAAAGNVLMNVDDFAAAFFARGAIKVTLLTATNVSEQERSRLKLWWDKVTGKEKAWTSAVVNAEQVKPVVIGEGLESLENDTLTESKRIDIAAALGIPYSVLFSNASNRATAEQDDLHLYSKTIVPECRFIERVMNSQLLAPLGYRLKFDEQSLDVFQADEHERAASINQYITALQTPDVFLIAADILGVEIAPDMRQRIEQLIREKEERRAEMAAIIPQPGQAPGPAQEDDDEEEAQQPPNLRALDLDKWRVKAIKRLKAGRPAAVKFESEHIDPVTVGAIAGALETAESEADVNGVFADTWLGYP